MAVVEDEHRFQVEQVAAKKLGAIIPRGIGRAAEIFREGRPSRRAKHLRNVVKEVAGSCIRPNPAPQDVSASSEARHPMGGERRLPNPRESDEQATSCCGVFHERAEAISLHLTTLEVWRRGSLPHVEDLPTLHPSLAVEESSQVEPIPFEAPDEVREPRTTGKKERDLVEAALRLRAAGVDDDDPPLFESAANVLRAPEPGVREEVGEPSSCRAAHVDMCSSDEPARAEASHRAGHVGAPDPERFRDPILDEGVRAG
jgi:hypothetical protein